MSYINTYATMPEERVGEENLTVLENTTSPGEA